MQRATGEMGILVRSFSQQVHFRISSLVRGVCSIADQERTRERVERREERGERREEGGGGGGQALLETCIEVSCTPTRSPRQMDKKPFITLP